MRLNTDLGLLLLRLTAGGTMLLAHGIPKLMKYETLSQKFSDPLGVGNFTSYLLIVFAEVVMAAFIMMGLYVRMAVLPLLFGMAIAFFIVHGDDPWQRKELAFLYMGMFTTLFCTGGGNYTVNRFFK